MFLKVKILGKNNKISYGYIAVPDEYDDCSGNYYNEEESSDYLVCYSEETDDPKTSKIEDEEAQMTMGELTYKDYDFKGNSLKMICDSGATEHLVNYVECLFDVVHIPRPIKICSANVKAPIAATKLGSIITRLQSEIIIVKIKNMLYASKLTKNLPSLRKLVQNGVDILLSNSDIKIIDSHACEIVTTGSFDGRF